MNLKALDKSAEWREKQLKESRVLELVNGDEQECSYCFIDYSDQTNLDFSTAPAAYQID
ncbi:3513_t:CDS:2, partial [Entrophospora sp. SA101]